MTDNAASGAPAAHPASPPPAAPAAPAAPPATAGEARTLLDALMANKAYAEKLLSGDYSANRQWSELQTMASNPDPADKISLAMSSSDLGFLPDSQNVELRGAAAMLREKGFNEVQLRESLEMVEGKEAPAGDLDIATRWKADNFESKEWQARYLSGDPVAARMKLAADVILTSQQKSF